MSITDFGFTIIILIFSIILIKALSIYISNNKKLKYISKISTINNRSEAKRLLDGRYERQYRSISGSIKISADIALIITMINLFIICFSLYKVESNRLIISIISLIIIFIFGLMFKGREDFRLQEFKKDKDIDIRLKMIASRAEFYNNYNILSDNLRNILDKDYKDLLKCFDSDFKNKDNFNRTLNRLDKINKNLEKFCETQKYE